MSMRNDKKYSLNIDNLNPCIKKIYFENQIDQRISEIEAEIKKVKNHYIYYSYFHIVL